MRQDITVSLRLSAPNVVVCKRLLERLGYDTQGMTGSAVTKAALMHFISAAVAEGRVPAPTELEARSELAALTQRNYHVTAMVGGVAPTGPAMPAAMPHSAERIAPSHSQTVVPPRVPRDDWERFVQLRSQFHAKTLHNLDALMELMARYGLSLDEEEDTEVTIV